jgi:hypothetical protein
MPPLIADIQMLRRTFWKGHFDVYSSCAPFNVGHLSHSSGCLAWLCPVSQGCYEFAMELGSIIVIDAEVGMSFLVFLHTSKGNQQRG